MNKMLFRPMNMTGRWKRMGKKDDPDDYCDDA